MKEYTTEKIRNICLAGQRGCGKTTLADAVAFCTGINTRIGRVDEGSSLLDYNENEIARKTSISSKLLACEWEKNKINLLDCPGHTDFMGELQACLKVTDAVGIVINANAGVEIGTQIHFKEIQRQGVPCFLFVNKMENENVKWENNLNSIKEAFGKHAVAVQLPIGEAQSFKGLIDLLHMKAYAFDANGQRAEIGIPADMKDRAQAEREALVEVAAEADDTLLEKFFENGTLDDTDMLKGLRQGIIDSKVLPVLFGSAGKNIGVRVLLDFIVDYLPSPGQRPPASGTKTGTADTVQLPSNSAGKSVCFCYKISSEGHLGDMTFVRGFSGTIKQGDELVNQQRQQSERINQIYTFQGKNRIEMTSIPAGDIGVFVKLKDTHINNTLAESSFSVTVSPIEFTNPVMDVSIKPKSKGDEEKIASGLHKIHEEDPTFKLTSDAALKQQVLYAQGPTHIDVLVEKLKSRFSVEVDLVYAKVPY